MDIQSAYPEEYARLEQTLKEIEQQLAAIGPRYYGDDFVEQVLDAKREETRQRLVLLEGEPYFGRLDFQEDGRSQPAQLYIGKRGMDRQDTGEPYVIDWRAPVASLFYSFTGGDAPVVYEAADGTIQGEILRKRNLSIREKAIQRVVDSYVRGGDNLGLSDEFLLYRLEDKKDNRLRDIVSTIQAEQDRIIRAPRDKALIIQGAAGSGKTTVALHRLAFLLYQYQEQIRAERMIIFAPNSMFLDYISGVLPELGVGNVRQTTFAEWALDLLDGQAKLSGEVQEGNRWFKLEGKRPAIDPSTPGRFKGSLAFKNWMAARLRDYEQLYLEAQDFEAWDGRMLQAETIRNWFEVEYRHYPLFARRERLEARLKRWLEMQLSEIADPKVRKEKSKTGKQRLRTYLKKLPEVQAFAFYKSLFEAVDHKADGAEKAGSAENAASDSGSGAEDEIPAGLVQYTRAYLKKGLIQMEDLAPLVWIHMAFHGPSGQSFDHVVVDEAQDVSPFQIALLNSFMPQPSFTILGDLAQGIHAYRGVHRWEELTDVFGEGQTSYHELRQSYRSTLEIIEFSNTIVPFTDSGLPPAQPVFRSGDPVQVVRLKQTDDRAERIGSFIRNNQNNGMRTIALIGRTDEDCSRIYALLERIGIPANLIAEGQNEYRGGISVVPVYLAKGLEFDAVLLADVDAARYTASPQDAKLLYVGCTRALHRLTLFYEGEASPLIK